MLKQYSILYQLLTLTKMVTLPINGAISILRPRPVLLNWYTFVYSKSMQFVWRSGIWLTTMIWRCRKPFGQWQRSFQRKLRSHWLKFLRQRHVAVVKQGLGAAIFYFLELHDFERGQRSGHSKNITGYRWGGPSNGLRGDMCPQFVKRDGNHVAAIMLFVEYWW